MGYEKKSEGEKHIEQEEEWICVDLRRANGAKREIERSIKRGKKRGREREREVWRGSRCMAAWWKVLAAVQFLPPALPFLITTISSSSSVSALSSCPPFPPTLEFDLHFACHSGTALPYVRTRFAHTTASPSISVLHTHIHTHTMPSHCPREACATFNWLLLLSFTVINCSYNQSAILLD